MANERQGPDPSGFTAENEIDLVLGNANPNPERTGCPTREVLVALARRERMSDDPAYEHLIKCSPCYREVRALQQAAGERRVQAAQSRLPWMAAAAAVVILAAVGAWYASRETSDVQQTSATSEVSPATDLNARLDLRKYSVARAEEKQLPPEPISLPRGRLNLTLLLPVGYEAGPYDVQLLDSNLSSQASATGNAEIRDYVATLQANLQTTDLAPGKYQLAVRRHGESWQMFPVELK